jgi:hypothetical protein
VRGRFASLRSIRIFSFGLYFSLKEAGLAADYAARTLSGPESGDGFHDHMIVCERAVDIVEDTIDAFWEKSAGVRILRAQAISPTTSSTCSRDVFNDSTQPSMASPLSEGSSKRERTYGREDDYSMPIRLALPPGAGGYLEPPTTTRSKLPKRGPETWDEVNGKRSERKCDVLIIGASLAGSCLARQLRLKWPDLDIVVIDKKKAFDYWVGEATVPPWADYAIRRCRLGPYLWKKPHAEAWGSFLLRLEEERSAALGAQRVRASRVHVDPSFQIDRATFDRDLCEMNRELGIEVLLGSALGAEGRSAYPDRSQAWTRGRDHGRPASAAATSSMRAGCAPCSRASSDSFRPDTKRLRNSSYWARFTGTRNMDEMGDDAWLRRVGFTERNLSANSYMYRGYWNLADPRHRERSSASASRSMTR